MMKVFWLLALFALTVSALPIEQDDRVNGENGWYVPQADGTFEWIDMEAAEAKMQQLELMEDRLLNPVTFYLYTAANPNQATQIIATPQSISASNFNPANPTRFVTHGFGSGVFDPMNKKIREAWLGRGDCNVIFVDWPRARSLDYASSVFAVPEVGEKIAALINYLVSNYGVSLFNVHLVGHSLGAHVAGFAGKNTNGQVQTIVGLDPALPLYSYAKSWERLAETDAFYVESVQTNGGGLGFLEPIGRGAFYPNGGETQPGCPFDVVGSCSHNRAVAYYIEAVKENDFITIACNGYLAAVAKNCGATYSSVRMGAVGNAYATGDFYVPVNGEPLYGMG